MHLMTPLEHNFLRNILVENFLKPSSYTHSLILNINRALQNKKPMVYIMQSQSGITTFKELK